MKTAIAIGVGAAAAIAFGMFVALAQTHAIVVPYFTPTKIDFQGLGDQYPVNGSMNYNISVKGYGSNCIAFEAIMVRGSGSMQEQVAQYGQIPDCRKIEISHGPYNYSRSFEYSGTTVLGEPGTIKSTSVFLMVTRQNYTNTNSFIVVESN